MYLKFGSSQGHIGAAASVGVLIFIMTSICALSIFFFLRDKDQDAAIRSRFRLRLLRTESASRTAGATTLPGGDAR
jgi:hypothetical protein